MADFTEEQIEQVWQKARVLANNNPDVFRQDYAGAWIRRDQYGMRNGKYGWEIDHCQPESLGGSDQIENLYPLHWRNNVSKGDDYPSWKTVLTSVGNKNIDGDRFWHM